MSPSAPRALPDGPLVAFYGDDFTGSSASMEVLAFAGLPTVLFLQPPSRKRLADFASMRAIGIAGTARAQSPAWMDAHLPDIFRLLAGLGAPVAHYKVCSTFDSAPHVGSIGRAADIGAAVFGPAWMPMVVGDPGMGRYQSFGHLFALADGTGYRLDRHPTMARHPVTPMDEADLGRHLARQTEKRIGLVDFVTMKRGHAEAQLDRALDNAAEIISLDVLDRETLTEAGRLIWERGGAPAFGIGSQGFEAALVAYWQAAGLLPTEPDLPHPKPVGRIACVSGSVSPVTAAQIAHALDNGFAGIRIDARRVVDPAAWEREIGRVGEAALAALGEGRDPLVYSATGPDDPAVSDFLTATQAAGLSVELVNERLGAGLGQVLRAAIIGGGLTRAVISGGDTSGRAAAQLGIDALTAIGPLDPGSPLCRTHGEECPVDGLEIALKGGQVGRPDFLQAVRQGGRSS
ncbi:four-carbon acid sugar kinase family protein [Azospirillum sp. YIM B02556]|uniref:Four-carbon acid sugar kinase family protein n=1 Tax=Azospirillum endophyticum TaxID=2800326 RepID=A0ABS1EY16_9PROT|nr:four-carbon acid sugar kinase family protein [Azospirillum endophyticum]MBK1836062.1 four-carbon acid sugar kinase family protein [Azospirillum endophyticum]